MGNADFLINSFPAPVNTQANVSQRIKSMDDIKLKRTQKLADKGFELLNDGEYEEALVISNELKLQRFSAAFDIGAQAQAGLGNMEEAIDLLQEGLQLAPNVWPNWQLLGNYLSDLDDFSKAKEAYSKALECDGVWQDSIYLNLAILSNRTNEFSEAINLSSKINDDELYLHRIEVNITALIGLNSFDEATKLADQVLSKEEYPEKDEEVVGRIAGSLAKIYLKQEKPKHEVREFLLHSLSYDQNNRMLLSLIRDIDNKYSKKANYYRALIHCTVPRTSPDYQDFKGYYCNYDVIAESKEDLLKFVLQFETSMVEDGNFAIEEYEILEKNSKDPCGVYFRSARSIYENEE